MKILQIKAVVLTDGKNYFIHGVSDETPDEMFKAMTPIWKFNPATETAHFVEMVISVPDFENTIKTDDVKSE